MKLNSSTTTETITINGDSTNQLQAYTAASSGTNVTNFGGLVGSYSCTNLEQSLIINKANTWIRNDNKQPIVIGGVVANVENNCYVKVDDATVVLDRAVADNNIAKDAGIIGLAGSGIFIDITGNVKVSTTNKNTAKIGAGLVGTSTSGIIRVSGQTDLSEASNGRSTGIDNANCSLLVNARNNTLVYALGNGQDHKTVTNEETGEVTESGWTLIRPYSNSANNGSRYNDDIGDWGCQIYRLIGEISDSKKTLEDAGVVSVTGHVVEVQKPTLITTVATEDTIEIAGTLDFAKTALYIQLNRDTSGYGSLAFEDSTCIAGTLLSKNIKFTGNVDLSESGFMGFTRMNEKDDNGTFKGSSIDGGNHYINLAMGEAYGYRENTSTLAEDMTVMSGVIHKENGNLVLALFYKVEPTTALAVKDLTIGGQVSAIVWKGNNGTTEGNLYMGGLAETVASGKIYNFSNVTSQTKFNFINNAETPVYIGGVFAIDGSGNNTYNISNCMIKPKINYDYASTLHKGHVYSGGFIGFVSNGKNAEINVNGTTIGTNTTTNNCTNKQYAGGLVGCFEQGNNIPTRKVVLNNVDINGANITLKSGSNNTAEESFTNIGLLGGRWYDVNVYFGSKTSSSDDYGVKITDATINLNNTKVGQNFYAGGLVSRASGYWQVNDVDVNGLKVNSTNASNRFGVLAGSCFDGGHALYLEITSSTAYTIASGGLTIGDVSKFDVLDEIAARSKKDETNRQGIVSIHTTSGKLSMAVTGNEYQLQSGYEKAKQNPNTRYYYNLDYLMQNFDSLPTSTDEEKAYKNGVQFLLWSINQYCLSNGVNNSGSPGGSAVVTANRKCFANFTTIPKKVTCNLEYLSYYPIDVTGNVTLEELTIKLNNSAMETAHGTNMSTRTANSQHYRMHEAVFKDVTGNITLSTKTSLKLQGNVPVIDGISGALICGTVQGNSVTKPAKLNLNNVILDGICLSNSSENGYDGLLVYKLGDYSTTTINRVSTTDAYNTDSTTTSTAAKTLISVAEGENTSITFTDMRLDGRKSTSTLKSDTHLDSAYNTHYSIFSVSTFVGSLKTNSAIYNYDHQEDWGTDGKTHTHHVTYGSEVYNSIENAGLQHWYLDKAKAKDANGYTSPVSYEASAAYDFATNGFLPHVSVPYTNGTDGQHEVAVNLVSVEIEQGCGTYNDPFVITDGAQLQAVANALNDTTDAGGFKKGFALYIDNDYGVSTTDINFEKWDSDISGGTNHTHYGFNGSKFVELDETGAETTTDGPSVDAVKQYLAGAYYVLQGSTEEGGNQNELTFSGIYPGLGGTVAKYAFRGVLIGKHTDSSKNIKIINNSDKPLIKLSMGSVVKNIDVEYKNAITITNTNQGNNKDRYTIDSTTLPYFGGVFGKIMGGDNIIDKVSVKYDSTVTITQNDNYKEEVIPMGGYVGAVVNGTLVFRNMTGISTDAASTGFTVKLNRRNTAYPSGMQVNDAICKQDMIPA